VARKLRIEYAKFANGAGVMNWNWASERWEIPSPKSRHPGRKSAGEAKFRRGCGALCPWVSASLKMGIRVADRMNVFRFLTGYGPVI
jgi:hypothetical protein